MAKRELHYNEAERLYVADHKTISAIAKELDLSERTIWAWKTYGMWEEKREKHVETAAQTHEKLYELINHLADKAIIDLKSGNEPSASQLYTLTKLSPMLMRLKNYEDALGTKEEKKTAALSQKAEESIAELLGLKTVTPESVNDTGGEDEAG